MDEPRWTFPVEIIEEDTETQARRTREQRAEQRELDNLRAQQGVNDATQRMADTAKYQTWLIGIGTLLLLLTLFFTRQANRAAVQGAKAAESAVSTTQTIGERQVRAYVHVTKVDLEHATDEFVPTINIHFKNFGQSPARKVINKVVIDFAFGGTPTIKEKPIKVDELGFDLGPGQETTTSAHVHMRGLDGLDKALEARFAMMYVTGKISYVDVFDEPRTTSYRQRLHVNPEGLVDTDSFIICKEGNEST